MHVVASSDHPRLPSFALYAPATMAVAPPAGPPLGPACPNHTSLGPNHGPQGSKEASQERRMSRAARGCPSHYGSFDVQT
ncbi:PERQ amino acid-rich with GYF domain-containing protein 2 isoform 1 [Dorcoceras hygrometricum]|uniref:PERQ amino acid-rich with GYF domain-containing protein 2 isoform 1 n=1 Tax=Dorcoceras hygrometricum TaxID=472368 RepID=A0A2Z7BXT9_9LAMI|nr:PERQ amino acid-rich with GYF domain-containing protein 2 isoform 1 [Dorcoceras hygrometricum]